MLPPREHIQNSTPQTASAFGVSGNMQESACLFLWLFATTCFCKAAHQVFYSDDALQHNVCLVVIVLVVDNSGAVDEEDALHEGDVLPHLGFTRDWSHLAHLQHATGNAETLDISLADQCSNAA